MLTETRTDQFENSRNRLHSIAYRLLGSSSEADDAVQETWLRLNSSDTTEIQNLPGWLTTVIARICLDMLRVRRAKRELPLGEETDVLSEVSHPGHEAEIADSVGNAMLLVLDKLAPAERVAFVMHDVFAVPFDDIAPILGRSTVATRQLASRGRRRVQSSSDADVVADADRQREVVEAFFRASGAGDFAALLAVLDPGVVLRCDQTALRMGARNGWITSELLGARAVAEQFNGRAQAAQVAIIDGLAGGVWMARENPIVAFGISVKGGRVVEIELIANPDSLGLLTIEI